VISYNANADAVYNAIIAKDKCYDLRNKIEVIQRHTWPEDGLDFIINFKYVEETLGQFELVDNGGLTIQDPDLDPLSSEDFTIYVWNSELSTRGPNVYYPVIPFEMIFTDETQPQVLVTVDDLPAVCKGLACGYAYTDPQSEVTAVSLSGMEVSLTGTGLPTTDITVTIASEPCTVDMSTNTDTSITCTIANQLMAGKWSPRIIGPSGKVPVSASLTRLEVALTITDVQPRANHNPGGGDLCTITGSGFCSRIDSGATVTIDFDGQLCDLTSCD
jgi:hypothetical protein